MVQDPVCKMEIAATSAAGTSTYQGKIYYFCAVSCKEAFDEDPGRYLEKPDILGRPSR